jgi:hypothetical protein
MLIYLLNVGDQTGSSKLNYFEFSRSSGFFSSPGKPKNSFLRNSYCAYRLYLERVAKVALSFWANYHPLKIHFYPPLIFLSFLPLNLPCANRSLLPTFNFQKNKYEKNLPNHFISAVYRRL